MVKPLDHPVFGRLVPDRWKEDLLTFREFPHLKALRPPDPEEQLRRVGKKKRAWVQDWRNHGAELAKVCRDVEVLTALQSLGVYEVSVAVGKDGLPSAEQAATYRHFLDEEETICRNVQDALLRYYRHVRRAMPDWFEGDDYPEGRTIEELAGRLGFDGIGIGRKHAHGTCLLTMGWDPAWDPEHGLQTTLYRGQVVEIGPSGESMLDLDPEDYAACGFTLWGPDRMNEAEKEALRLYLEGRSPPGRR